MSTPNGLNPKFNGSVTVGAATTVTTGGATGFGLLMSSTAANLGIFFGKGAPTITAAQGSLYINATGSSTSTRLYVNSDSSTTWVAVTTAS